MKTEVEYSEKVKWFYNHDKEWINQQHTDWSNLQQGFDERCSIEERAYDMVANQ